MRAILIAGCCLLSIVAIAQPGLSEMQQVRQDLSATFFSAFDCSLVLAAIFGITGAVRIYHNWQMGKDRIDNEVANWFFAAFFMVLAGAFLKVIFGI